MFQKFFKTNNSSYFQNTKTFFIGLSDFHKLVATMLKISFPKSKPLKINYSNYKHLDEFSFNEDLKLVLITLMFKPAKNLKEFL